MGYLQMFGNEPEKTKKLLNIKSVSQKIRDKIAEKTGLTDFDAYKRFVSEEYFNDESEKVTPGKKYAVATIIERDGKIEIFDPKKGKIVPLEQNPFISYSDTSTLTKDLKKTQKQEIYEKHSREMIVDWFKNAKNKQYQPAIVKLFYWREHDPWIYNFDSSYDGAIIGVRNHSSARYVGGKCCIVGPFMNESQMSKPLEKSLATGTPKISRIGNALIGMATSMIYQGKMMKIPEKVILDIVKSSFEEGRAVLTGKTKKINKPPKSVFDEMHDYIKNCQLLDSPPFKQFTEQLMDCW